MASSAKSKSSSPSEEEAPGGLAERVAAALGRSLFPGAHVLLGLSGGVDSVCLLVLLAGLAGRMQFSLRAVHVNHGLSPNADRWAQFCASLCARHGIRLAVEHADLSPFRHLGREGAARAARYRAFSRHEADFLALAQHRDDQAETLLLQLMRAAGPAGLAGMPAWGGAIAPFSRGVLRPLLGTTRMEIERFAAGSGLDWIEDESNADTSFDRNFVRHRVLPLLEERYPHARAAIARSASHLREAAGMLEDLGREDRRLVATDEGLDLARLRSLGSARAKNVLRIHCRDAGCPVPGGALLEQAWMQATGARRDAGPRVDLDGWALRRYRGRLYLERVRPGVDPGFCADWTGENALPLLELGGVLRMKPEEARGLSLAKLGQAPVRIRVRRGGERLRLDAKRPHRTLKNLLQERGVPPWRRDRLPLVYCGDALVAVPGVGESCEWRAAAGERGLIVSWEVL